MEKNDFILKTEDFVKARLTDYDSGHNWWHIDRVRRLSLYINEIECLADPHLIDLSALMHDVADSKFAVNNDNDPYVTAETFLNENVSDQLITKKVLFIMRNISFSSAGKQTGDMTPELKVVQDADRLDAMGAIGIARAFNYGGFRNREIFIPNESLPGIVSKEKHKGDNSSTVDHFYEKLLLLKGLMNTDTGRKLAEERHMFMELFLEQFYSEWNFNK